MKILLLMVLLHIIDDFVFQPICLSKLKQKSYWESECKKHGLDFSKYDKDYIVALFIHGLSWSIMIHLPLMFCSIGNDADAFLCVTVLANAVIHSIVDHYKANRLKFNLFFDQSIHMIQILSTFWIFCV